MNVRAYLVLRRSRRGDVRITRATAKRPYMAGDEAAVRIELQLPDDFFTTPVVVVPVPVEQIAVAVAATDYPEDVEEGS